MKDKITDEEILINVDSTLKALILKDKNILIAYHAIRAARSYVPINDYHLERAEKALKDACEGLLGDIVRKEV